MSFPTTDLDGLSVSDSPMPLTVLVESSVAHSIEPADAPVVIGREEPAQIRIADSRVSRHHLTLTVRGGHWVATDVGSTNGTFVGGEQVRGEYIIPDEGVTMNLGNPIAGIVVTFTTQDAGIVFAGAAVAKRRKELDISQRRLADEKVMNAGALINFEKGRSWPRQSTQHALEEVLGWPKGKINQLRRDFNSGGTTTTVTPVTPSIEPDPEKTVLLPPRPTSSHAVDPSPLAHFAETTLAQAKAQRAELPATTSRKYPSEIGKLVSSLSNLEALLHTASSAPEVRSVFLRVRTELREVMLEAATAPHATVGQQLFAARDRARLSVEDAAVMAGVPAASVIAFEAGNTVPDADSTLLHNFLASLQ